MAISSVFGAAASFFYAVSTLLGGAQNHAAIQKTIVQNFDSTPTHLIPRVSAFRGSDNNVRVVNSSAMAFAPNLTKYSVRFTPTTPNLAFRPAVSTYNSNEPSPSSATNSPRVDFYTLFPDLTASVRAGSGRMMTSMEPVGIAYYDGETIATVFVAPNGNVTQCELLEVNHAEEQIAALKQLAQENKIIEKIGFHGMLNLIKACQSLDVQGGGYPPQQDEGMPDNDSNNGNNNNGNGANQDPINPLDAIVGAKMNMWSMVSGILPGTKWCGLKDIAKDYNDLGPQRDLDKCCRSHDLCPRKVLAFRQAYGLVNWSLYSKSHCECDSALYDCLKRAAPEHPVAELVGNFYFNVLRVQCIDEENPPKCVQFDGFSCIKWENDESDALRLVLRDVRHRFR